MNKERKLVEQVRTEPSVKIRNDRGKLEAMYLIKRKLIKLNGSWERFFGVYTRQLEETKMSGRCEYKSSKKKLL